MAVRSANKHVLLNTPTCKRLHSMQHPAPPPSSARLLALCAVGATLLLTGCEYLGIESTVQLAEQKAAEGKAIGGACRHANRALEDCYRYNPKANKAAVFDGWKDFDVYMRENKLETISPVTPAEPVKKPPPAPKNADEEVITEEKDTKKADPKAADKKTGK